MTGADLILMIVDIIGILLIVISVLYLAKQTNQANVLAKGDSEREMFDSFHEIISRYSDFESIELIQKGLADYAKLSNKERARFCLIYFIPHVNFLDQILGLFQKRLVSKERFRTTTNIVIAILKTNGGQAVWQELRGSYRQAFVDFINQRLRDADHIPPITKFVTGFEKPDQ